MATGLSVCTDAALELGYLDPIETLNDDDANFLLGKLNRLLDRWNAKKAAVYAEVFTPYVITPSLSPHTIGPSGATWTATQRPVSIEGANLIDTTVTPNVRLHLNADRDEQWWLAQSVQGITSTYPTDLYYKPSWPNGAVYLWPVPTVAYSVELMTRTVLAALTLASSFSMPPAYADAVTLTLAEDAAAGLGCQVPGTVVERAKEARADVFANNTTVPKLTTRDAGMPGGRRSRGSYLTGWQ